MAKTAKTTGIYANMIACIGVDDDNTTVKDFVVSAGRTITLESGVTVVNGAYGYGVRTVNIGSYSPRGMTLSPRILRNSSSSEARTVIYILNTFTDVEDTGGSSWEHTLDSASGGSSTDGNYKIWDNNPVFKMDTDLIYDSGANSLAGVKSMTVMQYEWGASPKAIMYHASNGDAFPGEPQHSDTTDRNLNRVTAYVYRIGGHNAGLAMDVFLMMEFNGILSQSDLATIYNSLTGSGACDCFAAASTSQFAAPTSDISVGNWVSTGANLYSVLDEPTTPNDADYVYVNSDSTMEVKFASVSDPATSTGHKVRYRIKGNGVATITVSLRQGSDTEIASWTHATASTTTTTHEQTLTSGQADSITDYADLRLRFVTFTP